MPLPPPLTSHISGPQAPYTSRSGLAGRVKVFTQEVIEAHLTQGGYLTPEGKIARKALEEGLVDTCEGKALWHVAKVKAALVRLTRPARRERPQGPVKPAAPPQVLRQGPAWVDLDTVGTYFGVGKIQVGKWLDQLGLREVPPLPSTESGTIDMLDVAAQAKEKQAAGFLAKKPTEEALASGYARIETIEYKKKGKEKSFDKITWNLDLVKALLVKTGHELDTERKMMLKGKGKNSDVKVEGIQGRVQELHGEWQRLHRNPATRKESWNVFKNQPTAVVKRVEALLGAPGFITDKRYLTEELKQG